VSKINIKVKQVKAANKDLVNLSSRVDGVGNQISSVRQQIDGRIASRRNIGRNLNEAAAKVREAEKKLKKIHQFVDVSMDLYVKGDKKADRFKEPEKKSVWDKMKDLFGTANDVVSGFRKGVAKAVFSTFEGIWNAITHPIETAKGIVYAVSHPVETAKSIWKSISDSWKNDVVNGDAKSRSQWFGRAVGEVALAIIGTKGVDKAVKMAKGAKVVEETGGVRVVKPETIEKKDGGEAVEKRVTPEKKDSGVGVEKREVPQKIDGNGDKGSRSIGKVYPTRQINSVEEAHIIDRVKELRGNLTSRYKKSGNFAVGEVNVNGINKSEFYAQSSINDLKGNLGDKVPDISLQPKNPMFKATEAVGKDGESYLRDTDTEYKILNDIAARLGDNTQANGKIKLFTELDTCDSCSKVIAEFAAKYKNIEIEIIHNNGNRIIP
jgi:hypothetical protein